MHCFIKIGLEAEEVILLNAKVENDKISKNILYIQNKIQYKFKRKIRILNTRKYDILKFLQFPQLIPSDWRDMPVGHIHVLPPPVVGKHI
jgi:hypothetical protein